MLKDRRREAAPPAPKPEDTSVAKFFEEIKVLVRDVPERVAMEVNNGLKGHRGKRRYRFHAGMLEDLFYHPGLRESGNPALPLLIGSSLIRDDFPWLYEIAAQFGRAIESGDTRGAVAARKSFMDMTEMLYQTPLGEMLGMRDDDSMMLVHTLRSMVERGLPELSRVTRASSRPTTAGKRGKGQAQCS
jgi:hypothetical protein